MQKLDPLRPLDADSLIGRFVKIPFASFPDFECSEYGGSGWRGKVVSTTKKRGKVTSVCITDGWKVGAEATTHNKISFSMLFAMKLEVVA